MQSPDAELSAQATTVRDLLWEVCPLECEYLGKRVVEDIARGQRDFQTFEGGGHMELKSIMETVFVVANVAWFVIQKLDEHRKRNVGKNETRTQSERPIVVNIFEQNTDVPLEFRQRLLEALLGQIAPK
jgi:hypothetical protein